MIWISCLVLSTLIIPIDMADMKWWTLSARLKNIFGFFRGAADNLLYQIYWRMKIAVIMLMSIRYNKLEKERKSYRVWQQKTHCKFNKLSAFKRRQCAYVRKQIFILPERIKLKLLPIFKRKFEGLLCLMLFLLYSIKKYEQSRYICGNTCRT